MLPASTGGTVRSLDNRPRLRHYPGMWVLAAGLIPTSALLLMVVAMALLYVASRSAVSALVRTWPSPGLRGAAQAAPIIVVAYVAMLRGQSSLAFGICLGCSVAALSLVNGVVLVMAPSVRPITPGQRAWPLAAIAAGLLLLSGFSGELTLLHAAVLAVEGLAVYAVWADPAWEARRIYATSAEKTQRDAPYRLLLFVLALGVAGLGAWAATSAVKVLMEQTRLFTVPLLSASLLTPMLILPMIGTSGELAHLGRSDEAIGSTFALALVCLCAVVPSLVVMHHVRAGASLLRELHEIRAAWQALPGLAYPLSFWRIDTVAVLILGLFFLPAALGKWALTRWEGLALIVAYAAYLAGHAWMAGR